jgi:hypothetical protein
MLKNRASGRRLPPQAAFDRQVQQVRTRPLSTESVMASESFLRGVSDARRGLAPRFDGLEVVVMLDNDRAFTDSQWNYERGRQFAILAPRDLRVMRSDGVRVNEAALAICKRALIEGLLI